MTLHVRMVSPPDLTELLADALIADSGVSNLVVLAIGALVLRLQRIIWHTRSRAEQPEAGSPLPVSEPSAGGSG